MWQSTMKAAMLTWDQTQDAGCQIHDANHSATADLSAVNKWDKKSTVYVNIPHNNSNNGRAGAHNKLK